MKNITSPDDYVAAWQGKPVSEVYISRVVSEYPPEVEKALLQLSDDDPAKIARTECLDSDTKARFIKQLFKNRMAWYKTCEAMGLSPFLMKRKFRTDEKLRAACELAAARLVEDLESVARAQGLTAKGVTDRWRLLEAYDPERFSRQTSVAAIQLNFSHPPGRGPVGSTGG